MRVKVYDKEMIDKFNSLLKFEYDDENVIVSGYNRPTRKTYHPRNEKFDVNMKSIHCKVRFLPEVVELWINAKLPDYTLFEFQNAANILISSYQEINMNKILEIISKK